jgi:short-subunit dehydrogenase
MKTILITGAASGIGESLAKILASDNHLILTYHQSLPEHKLPTVEYLQLNTTNDQDIIKLFNFVKNKYTKIDILINNAGICLNKKFIAANFSEIDIQINTNLTGLVKLTYQFLPIITEKIINIGSECSKLTYPDYAIYCATKFGVRGFTQALSTETKLKIYCANPGPTATKMNGFYGAKPEEVAQIIINKLIKKSNIKSGSDLDIYKMFNFT